MAVPSVLDVPAAGINLDESHTLLEQPTRNQALSAEVPGPGMIEAIALARLGILLGQINYLCRLCLHPKGQLVTINPRSQLAVRRPGFRVLLIQRFQEVEG